MVASIAGDRLQRDVVVDGDAYDRGGAGEVCGRVGALGDAVREPGHGAVAAVVERLGVVVAVAGGVGGGDADEVEAEAARVGLDLGGELVEVGLGRGGEHRGAVVRGADPTWSRGDAGTEAGAFRFD